MAAEYPCPCCGHVIFLEPPGSYDICEICFWEDDIVMLRWPSTGGGANDAALVEAQRNYAEFGAGERAHLAHVRPPKDDEPIEPGWRPIDLERDNFEPAGVHEAPWPEDSTVLYWWRPTFWRREILHITRRSEWEQALAAGSYEPPSLAREGFIHFSDPHQVAAVAKTFYAGVDDLVLLHVSTGRVTAPLKYEAADGDKFPHLYGALNLDAVIDVTPLADDGNS